MLRKSGLACIWQGIVWCAMNVVDVASVQPYFIRGVSDAPRRTDFG